MRFTDAARRQLRPSSKPKAALATFNTRTTGASSNGERKLEANVEIRPISQDAGAPVGVAKVEAIQAVYGKYGKYGIWLGLAMIMIVFELDNATVNNYQNYATSSFNNLSLLSTLSTAFTIISAIIKPPIAKISDVIGRGETYLITVSSYVLAYILFASSKTINAYAVGIVFYAVGQAGTQILNQIVFSDISTPRWRGFVLGMMYFPFLITPWISAFIVDDVVAPDGIGWRWGIGMFAVIMPFASSFIIGALLFLQRKAGKSGLILEKKLTVYEFCSLVDLGGMILLCGGFAMLLLPFTLAASTPSKWKTPWVDAVIVLGVLFLASLIPYEKFVAKHPVVPVHYGKNCTIVIACLMGAVDTCGFSATHVYLYAWAVVTHEYSARDATFLAYTNGVTQCLFAIVAGAIMYKTRRYKWLTMAGVVIRVVGYGAMIRLRGAENSRAELFGVQLIQGIGTGFIQQIIVVAAQISVPHAELAQVSALVLLTSFLGSAVGSCIAGGIYTNTFKNALRKYMGAETPRATIEELYESITGVLPEPGTPARHAVNLAYSEVMKHITIAAVAISVPLFVGAWLLPDLRLDDRSVLPLLEARTEEQAAPKDQERGHAHEYGREHRHERELQTRVAEAP